MNIYVGNLSYQISEDELRAAFEAFGPVEAVHIIKDRQTGQSKGFGFVEMPSAGDGQTAIEALNGKELSGRKINVNEARAKPEGGRSGGSRGPGGTGGGRGARLRRQRRRTRLWRRRSWARRRPARLAPACFVAVGFRNAGQRYGTVAGEP